MGRHRGNQCRDCAHLIWGYSTTKQTSPVRVCEQKPKRIWSDISPEQRQYYYSQDPSRSCSEFMAKGGVA